jgi:hypothetical protein
MCILFNACRVAALFCAMGLVSPTHAIAQVQTQDDLPRAPEKKKPDTIDFLHKWVSPTVLSAATSVDVYTTAHNLDHPTVAYREDGTFLTNYYVVEKGWARCFGNRSPFAASFANASLNAGVMVLSDRLYLRGGRWRIAALALVLAKAGANLDGGIQNERFLGSIDQRVRLETGYRGVILWSSRPQKSH